MNCDIFYDCARCPFVDSPLCSYCGDDDPTDYYPPCEFVDDCADFSLEN